MKYSQGGSGIVVGGDAIDGQSAAFHALVDQHQLTSFLQPVLIPAILCRQTDGFHLPLAGGQPIAGSIQIEMA
ncbi:MAG TPA: hypothetical protein VK909_15405 [Anaerolineales bacterium]|nr:hypothetical protein [Anaerolineales bacterium]